MLLSKLNAMVAERHLTCSLGRACSSSSTCTPLSRQPPPAEPPAPAPPRRPKTTRHRRPGQPSRPPAPTLNPKIDSGVPLRRAPVPAAGGSSLTPASPPTPENRLTQKSIQSTEVWLNRSRAAARARGRAAAAAGRASDRARAGAAAAARASEREPEQQQQIRLVWTPPPKGPRTGGEPPWRCRPRRRLQGSRSMGVRDGAPSAPGGRVKEKVRCDECTTSLVAPSRPRLRPRSR